MDTKIELKYKVVEDNAQVDETAESKPLVYFSGVSNPELDTLLSALKGGNQLIVTAKIPTAATAAQTQGGKSTMKIAQDKVAEIEYVLTVDGKVEDQSEPGDPLVYLHGHNNIIPGLEDALEGHQAGDKLSVTVTPEHGYGERDDENVQVLPRADFDDDIEVGASYFAQSDDGSVNPFTVVSVSGDDVTVDFNPPLAGQTLNFEVTVVEVRDATAEELEHGHAHGEDMDDEDE